MSFSENAEDPTQVVLDPGVVMLMKGGPGSRLGDDLPA